MTLAHAPSWIRPSSSPSWPSSRTSIRLPKRGRCARPDASDDPCAYGEVPEFGGHFAAFDPVSNLRVGVKVLQECIATRRFDRRGLRFTWAPASLPDDGGYTAKVMAEHSRLRQVANGRSVPVNAPVMLPPKLLRPPAQAVPAASRNAGERPRPKPTARWRCSVLWAPDSRCLSPGGAAQYSDQTPTKTPGGLKAPPPGSHGYLSYTTRGTRLAIGVALFRCHRWRGKQQDPSSCEPLGSVPRRDRA